MKQVYKRVRCHRCGKWIAENWLVRHRKSGCTKGIVAALAAVGVDK